MRALGTTLIALVAALAACSDDESGGLTEPPVFALVGEGYAPGALFSVWSDGPDDVWVVGGERNRSVVLRFDGTSWRRDDPPTSAQLWWVHGFSGGPVYVVGDGGTIARRDAAGWEVLDSGHPGTTLFGIWGATPDELWAVGGPDRSLPEASQEGDVILRHRPAHGPGWERVRLQVLDDKPASAQKNLFKVWGASPEDVFIVGDGGLVLQYDGATWHKADSGVPGIPLFTVVGRSARDVWAVGGFGSPVVIHWDGASWREVDLPLSAPAVLQGIWTAPGAPVTISGFDGFIATLDGGRWFVSNPVTREAYHAVWGDGRGLWAAGGDIVSFRPEYQGALAVTGREAPPLPSEP